VPHFGRGAGHPGQAAQQRRSGIHAGTSPTKVPAWIPGLPAVAWDDRAFCWKPIRGVVPWLADTSPPDDNLLIRARRH